MTGSELVVLTKQHAGNRSSSTYDTAWYLARVNEAMRWVATYHNQQTKRVIRFPELHDIVDSRLLTANPSNNFVANSSGVYATLALYNETDSRPVSLTSFRDMTRRGRTDAGAVQSWVPYGEGDTAGYLIWRIPSVNTEITEYVYKYPTDLTTSTSPVFDEAWQHAIHLKAGSLAAMLQGRDEEMRRLGEMAVFDIEQRQLPGEDTRVGGRSWFRVGGRR